MRLVTFIFNRSNRDYRQLLKVWEASAEKHMPDVPRTVIWLDEPPKVKGDEETQRHYDMCYAFLKAAEWVLQQNEDVIVTDVDLMFTGDMADAFSQSFDIAVTKRNYRHPFNSGVWYFRNNKKARLFVQSWIGFTKDILKCKRLIRWARKKHGGIDQGSLALAVDSCRDTVAILPCRKWNAEQSSWADIDKDVRCIHIKSAMRKYCLEQRADEPPEHIARWVDMWKGYP